MFLNHEPIANPESTTDESLVRAYLMTNGRTQTTIDLSFESMLSVVEPRSTATFSFEKARVIDLCALQAQSVAELAAQMRVPIGTARVLAGDLVVDEVLEAHMPQSNASADVDLLKRLIRGVRAL
jgi:Protein of unknown function (DUF742)